MSLDGVRIIGEPACVAVMSGWKQVEQREGSNQTLSSRFAAVRIRPVSRDHQLAAPHPLEWLVVECPEGEAEPIKYWLSTLPKETRLSIFTCHQSVPKDTSQLDRHDAKAFDDRPRKIAPSMPVLSRPLKAAKLQCTFITQQK